MEKDDIVIALLREPREHFWGILIRLDAAGIELRGIEMGIFEEWCRELASNRTPELGVSTLFFPSHRIERISLDEQIGVVPSSASRFSDITGQDPKGYLKNEQNS